MDYNIIIFIFFGTLPSLIWLAYYLREDVHPEPKAMILKVFLWGAFMALPVFLVQLGLMNLLDSIQINEGIKNIIYWFFVIAFSEELFKYFVIKFRVIKSPHLDEPVDVMLYMVVAALGFAALENILYLFVPSGQMSFQELIGRTLTIDLVRFLGAIFLHTLCSAIVGYALALSFCKEHGRKIPIALGIITATLLHGFYDFSIMTLDGYLKYTVPAIVIIILAFLVFSAFARLRKLKGICLATPDLPKGDKIN